MSSRAVASARPHVGDQVGESLTSEVHAPRVARRSWRRPRAARGRWTRRRRHGNLGRCRPPSPCTPRSTTWPWPSSSGPTPGPATPSSSVGHGARAGLNVGLRSGPTALRQRRPRSRSSNRGNPRTTRSCAASSTATVPAPITSPSRCPTSPPPSTTPGDAGFSPVGVDLTNPDWKEAFLHPRQATGIVVQLAQAAYAVGVACPRRIPHGAPQPAGVPGPGDPRRGRPRRRPGSVRGAPGRNHALGSGSAPDRSWDFVDLQWPGPPALRLIAPAPGAERGVEPGVAASAPGWDVCPVGCTTWRSRCPPGDPGHAFGEAPLRRCRAAPGRGTGAWSSSRPTTSARASCVLAPRTGPGS